MASTASPVRNPNDRSRLFVRTPSYILQTYDGEKKRGIDLLDAPFSFLIFLDYFSYFLYHKNEGGEKLIKSGIGVLLILSLVFCFIAPAEAEEMSDYLSFLDAFSIEEQIMVLSDVLAKLSALSTKEEVDEEAEEVVGKAAAEEAADVEEATDVAQEAAAQIKEAAAAQSFEGFHLRIFGRKVIGVKYKGIHYLGAEGAEPEPPTSETDIEQELQVKVEGGVGEKILVNVDYDDTAPRTKQQKISLRYEGGEDEILKEAAVGDLRLDLPSKGEFLSYNRTLFGARAKVELGKWSLTGIGAITKGILETKTFTGKTSFEMEYIPDTAYLERKYYQFYFDSSHLPLTLDSAKIYIDDQDGTNNETSLLMVVIGEGGDSYTGYFDPQYLGEDYFLDYTEGVINFRRDIEENFVIAISYEDKDGKRHPETGHRMIKKGQESLYIDKYELKNYYYLGSEKIQRDDFLLRIFDLSENDVTSNYTFEIDYELGILKFTSPFPPFPEVPPSSSQWIDTFNPNGILVARRGRGFPRYNYIIYVEYSHTLDVYTLRPDIVPESESVYMNEKRLTKDIDYQIDYSSGFLSFLDPSQIIETTEIKVDYEWMPFAGGKGVIWGARLEFTPYERLSLGSTFLSQAAFSLREVPHLDSTPSSGEALGVDTQYDFSLNLGKAEDTKTLLHLSFTAELGKSTHNPNTFGKAMVEDFESTKVRDELSMDKDTWQLGSRPDTQEWVGRDEIEISSENLPGDEINPGWSSEERGILVLGYSFSPLENWDSIVYSISSIGRDYSQRKFLELWVKGEGKGEFLTFDLGVVSEDADGDGQLDTEDKNGDGRLNLGEDTGIDIGGRLIGEGNGKLDTEDLDGDGVLDTLENYARYDWNIEPELKIEETGWKKITLPLDAALDWDSVKSSVKHLRLWIKGEASGTLRFALIGISGDRWQEGGDIEVKPVNNEDDPEYNPFTDEGFRDYYEMMYGYSQTGEGKWKKEASLRLGLPSAGEGWVEQTFVKAYDWSDYKTLNFWIFGDEKGENFYLRLGANVSEAGDYYEKEVPINYSGWRMLSVPLAELSIQGNPSFKNIKQLRAGIKDASGPVEIYLNDIFLSGVKQEEGLAKSITLKGDMGESFSFIGQYKEIEDTFSTIGNPSSQGLKLSRLGVNFSLAKSVPLSYQWSKEEVLGDLTPETGEAERIVEEKSEYELAFLYSHLPKVSLKIQNKFTSYPSREEKKKEETWRLSLEYKNPYPFPLLPTFIQTSYEAGERQYGNKIETGREEIKSWQISFPFQLLKNLTLKPVYRQKSTDELEGVGGKRPKLREKSLSLSSQASFFHLSPSISFQGGYKEDNFSLEDSGKRNIFTQAKFSLTLPLEVGAFFSKSGLLKSLKLYGRYELTNQRFYEDTTTFLDLGSGLGLKELDLKDGRTKLILEKESFSLRERWRPFSFLSLASDYSQEERKEIRDGTVYTVGVNIWPSFDISLDLNKMPSSIGRVSRRLFTSSHLIAGYIQKATIKEGISSRKTYQPSLIWRGGFKESGDLGLTLSYKSVAGEEAYFSQGTILKDFSSSYEVKMDCFTSFPKGMRIPFLARIIDFKNKIHLSLGFNLETKKSSLTPGRVDEDNLTWKLFTQMEYKVHDNVQLRLGLEGGYLEDKVRAGEDHYFWGGSTRVEIRF